MFKKDEDIELLFFFNSDFYFEKEINVSLKSFICVELIVELILFKKKIRIINKINSIRKIV